MHSDTSHRKKRTRQGRDEFQAGGGEDGHERGRGDDRHQRPDGKNLAHIIDGEELGTLFVPAGQKRSSRSRWIGSVRPAGTIVIDDGAVAALVEKNKSLLPAGIVKVEGEFARGDIVSINAHDGRPIARGLSNYTSADIETIRGKKTSEVRAIFAERAYDEVVHRDNLVMELNH